MGIMFMFFHLFWMAQRDKITGVGSVEPHIIEITKLNNAGMPGSSPTVQTRGGPWPEPHDGHLPQQAYHWMVRNLQQRTLSDPQQHAAQSSRAEQVSRST